MVSTARTARTVRAATITVILAAFAVLPGCLHDSAEPDPLAFIGPSAPDLWGPLPSFSFSPQKPDAGDTVSFDASGSSTDPGFAIASYAWSFAGGSPPTATGATATASTTYGSEGTFTVSLTVTDNRGSATPVTQRQSVVVGAPTPPTADFVFSIAGTVVNFDGTTSTTEPGRTITSYRWTFGDGSPTVTGPSATVSHDYGAGAANREFNVTLRVEDTAMLTGSTFEPVKIP